MLLWSITSDCWTIQSKHKGHPVKGGLCLFITWLGYHESGYSQELFSACIPTPPDMIKDGGGYLRGRVYKGGVNRGV